VTGSDNRQTRILMAVALVISAATLAGIILVYGALPGRTDKATVEESKKMAGELADNNLPAAAIEEYRRVLDRGDLDDQARGAVCYLIGKTYFEDIGDYENAAAYYVRARSLDPNASYNNEAGKNLIAALEKMGRRLDARRELDRQTNLIPDTTRAPGKIVAKIGNREITLAEYNETVRQLPQEMQDKLTSPQEKRKFLDQMVGRELIYDAAMREGLDRDPAILRHLKGLEKDYLTQYFIRRKVAPTINPDEAELEMYFKANKDKYGGKELKDVDDQVMQDYIMYKGQKAIGDYINGLSQTEKVQVFEENLK
jgi:tetratricopeptide (TPR) repeat protein